jgi:transcription elongation GreA/GreB family factor
MNTKQELYNKCEDFLNSRLKVIKNTISGIQNSLQSETKSSAGDKHETGRAMLQLEREKAGNQLAEIQKTSEILNRINAENQHKSIALGSVVYTSQFNYFIAISAGEIIIDAVKFYAISPSTPIAKLLLSKEIGDKIQFRNSIFVISKIE